MGSSMPEGWVRAELGEALVPVQKCDPQAQPDSAFVYLDISSIDNHVNRITNPKHYKGKNAPSRARQIVKKDDTLFSTVRPYLRNIAQVPREFEGQIASTGFCVIRPYRECEPKFFFYLTLWSSFLSPLSKIQRGTSYPAVRDSDVFAQQINIPPLNEQRRIVEKIEQLFSELDKSVEFLKTVKKQLKVYRQVLLKHAFEGKLTEQWRKENPDKIESADKLLARIKAEREKHYKEQVEQWEAAVKEWEATGKEGKKPSKPKKLKELPELSEEELRDLPELPEGWGWGKVDILASSKPNAIKAGPFGSSLKKEGYTESGYKVYGQEQVIGGDWFIGDYYVSKEKYEQLGSCKVAPNDILISLVGTVGKVLVLPEECEEGVINPRLVKISPNLDFYSPYTFKYYFESAFMKKLYSLKTHGATMDVLNLGIISELPFPVFSLPEQIKLNTLLEEEFLLIHKLENLITQEITRVGALRQSILKQAFEGKLVPQDQNDEPASVLLERIKEEKAKLNGHQKKKPAVIKSKPKRKTA